MRRPDRLRRVLPGSLAGLAGLACAACCLVPALLAAGVLGGAGWAAFGRVVPGIALALVTAAALTWWQAIRRRVHAAGCSGGRCDCGG